MPPVSGPKKDIPATDRPVIYDKVDVFIAQGDTALTEDVVKEMLGWEEVQGEDYMTVDEDDKKIRCNNNTHNRPFDRGRAEGYAQEILKRHWAGPRGNGKTVNGEAVVIGRTGETLSFQHRGVGLVFACQRWRKEDHWRTSGLWPEPPVMESVIVTGVDESDLTTMTIDNVKPSTPADAFYRDPLIFPKVKGSDRRNWCKVLEFAVRFAWHRTGLKQDAYAPLFNPAEAKEFVANHPSILRAVKHIMEENTQTDEKGKETKSNVIKAFCPLGTAAGMCWLMGLSNSVRDQYHRSEVGLDKSNWDKAAEFWLGMAKGSGKFKTVIDAIRAMGNADGSGSCPAVVRDGMIAKAWLVFSGGNPLTEKQLGYEYLEMKNGGGAASYHVLVQNGLKYEPEKPGKDVSQWMLDRELVERGVSVGGIDLGDPEGFAKEQRDAEREEERETKRKLAENEKLMKAQQAEAKKKEESRSEILGTLHQKYPEKLLIWEHPEGFVIWGSDALRSETILETQAKMTDGLRMVEVKGEKKSVRDRLERFKRKGITLGVCGSLPNGDYGYKGDYDHASGGYLMPDEDESPTPVTPLSRVAGKTPAKPTLKPTTPAPAAKPTSKTGAKPPAATKETLKGGIK